MSRNRSGCYWEYYKGRRLVENAFSEYLEHLAETTLKDLKPDAKILEICCGDDYVFDHMPKGIQKKFQGSWLQTDRKSEVIADNIKRHPKRRYQVMDVTTSDLGSDCYDLVLCLAGLDQIGPVDLDITVNKMHQALKKDGQFFHVIDITPDVGFFYQLADLWNMIAVPATRFYPHEIGESEVDTPTFGFFMIDPPLFWFFHFNHGYHRIPTYPKGLAKNN